MMLERLLEQLVDQTVYIYDKISNISYQGQVRSLEDGVITMEFHDDDGSSLGFVALDLSTVGSIQYGHPVQKEIDARIKALRSVKNQIEKAFSSMKGECDTMFPALFPSRTVALALSLVVILSRAFELQKPDEWIRDRLPFGLGYKRGPEGYKKILASGRAFIKDCYDLLHE